MRKCLAGLVASWVLVAGAGAWAADEQPPSETRLAAPDIKLQAWLEEPSGNQALEGDESGVLRVRIRNEGNQPTTGLKLELADVKLPPGLQLEPPAGVRDMPPGREHVVDIHLTAAKGVQAGQAEVAISALDAAGFDSNRLTLRFKVNAYRPPVFRVSQTVADDSNNGQIELGDEVQAKVEITNQGGTAKQVSATLKAEHPGLEVRGKAQVFIGELLPGRRAVCEYQVLIKRDYDGPRPLLPLRLTVSEAFPENTCKLPVPIALQQLTEPRAAASSQEASDVDTPRLTPAKPRHVVAVVIGIERYSSGVPSVPFARKDAEVVRGYVERTLGARPDDVITLLDDKATGANIRKALALEGQLAQRVVPGTSEVVVYYAGHGAPDDRTRQPYIVPYDGHPGYLESSCYPMAEAYKALGNLRARTVTVMLDACFSGGAARQTGDATLIANARPLFVEQATGVPPGVNVLAASTGAQLSSGLPSEHHGIFTYYLLKAMQGAGDLNQDRQITLGELQRYVGERVSKEARRLNREQKPVLLGGGENQPLVSY
jgi:hypothetical protein